MSKDSKLTLVKQQLATTPNMKAATVAKHLGISQEYAYNLMSMSRRALGLRKQPDGTWKLKERMQATPRDEKAIDLLAHMQATPISPEEIASANKTIKERLSVYETPDNVNHPAHYTHGGIETIDFIQAKLTPEEFRGYLKGNILKYGSRLGHKDNDMQDAGKLAWYTNKLRSVLATK